MFASAATEPIKTRHSVPSLRLVTSPDSLGQRIKDRRKDQRLTQEQLARQLPGATSGQQVSNWERNLHIPSPANLRALADILGDDLVDGLPSAPPSQLDRIEKMLRLLLETVDPSGLQELDRELRPFEVLAGPADTALQDAQPEPGRRGRADESRAPGRK